ncbi:FAD dependent oxidoreductase [Zychaea mexicana]|uniref:FAD dependent oxidoreductase n=1 Tax=Zychaea mexicana TaxID=64656 RepID=UPI0022FF1B69|nr:FAD dependent oxidoreductase [Zychaea mexicana]KAI9493388.1 FAD dependent oxidoreductase [Zychaea mexicana]
MYTPPVAGSKIIVVGAGTFGLSTAYALALKKYNVWVYDRNTVPSADASSTDINKCVRMDYGGDTLSMQLMMEAYPHWHQWNKERAEMGLSPVFHQTGCLLLCKGDSYSDYERSSIKHIREAGYGHTIQELPTPESIIERFPQFKDAVDNGYKVAYLNTEGGWCNSSETIKHLYQKCVDNGVQFIIGSDKGAFEQLLVEDDVVRGIRTRDKVKHIADHVVLAAGPWTASLLDFGGRLQATGQAVIQFSPPPEFIEKFKDSPVWGGDISRTGFYGFPINAEGKMKIASHSVGYVSPRSADNVSVPRTQVTYQDDTIPVKALDNFRKFLGEFMPETDNWDISYSRVCWYSDTTDGKFLVAPHPDYKNLVIASGDSGHAMKFTPNIGFKITQVIEGIETDYSRAWSWKESNNDVLTSSDGTRNITSKPLTLGVGEARMASKVELKAPKKKSS